MRVGLLLDGVNKIEAEKVTQVAILLSSVVPRIGEVRVFEIYSTVSSGNASSDTPQIWFIS